MKGIYSIEVVKTNTHFESISITKAIIVFC